MGIYQHHDGISGTAKQLVADDYAWLLFNAMQTSNEVYSNLIKDEAQKVFGLPKDATFEWCLRTNSTYLDCPVAKHDKTGKPVSMIVGVHNPAL